MTDSRYKFLSAVFENVIYQAHGSSFYYRLQPLPPNFIKVDDTSFILYNLNQSSFTYLIIDKLVCNNSA